MKRLLTITALLVALVAASSAAARSSYGRYYIDELTVGNSLEAHGFLFEGRHVAVDNAFCLGLRRYGVRTSAYGLDRYWRFKCDASGANGHGYTLQVSTTTGPKRGYYYWHVLSAHLDY